MAVAITEPPLALLTKLLPLWHRSAPRFVREECDADNVSRGSTAWRKYLAHRKRPETPPFLQGKHSPLLWGLGRNTDFGLQPDELLSQVESAGCGGGESVAAILEQTTNGGSIDAALHALAIAYALPKLVQRTAPETWWELLSRLHEIAADAAGSRVDVASEPELVLRQQLLAGELPLALSYSFPELRGLRGLGEAAAQALSESLVELTDGQGLPHGRLLPVFLPLWASWTRARWLGRRTKRGRWSNEAEVQYQWLVRHAIRLTSPDGQLMLADRWNDEGETKRWSKGLYRMALELVGDRSDFAAAAAALPLRALPKRARRRSKEQDLPDVSLNSEWSGVAVMASDWSHSSLRLAMAWAEPTMSFEFGAGRERLLVGDWTFRTSCNGENVSPTGSWEQSCWQSDKTCDYLELHLQLTHGLRLERQVLLARAERVAYLADVLVADDGAPRRLTHQFSLPVGQAADWQPEIETRDGVLIGDKARAAVMPVALAEWRSDPRYGELQLISGGLTLSQERTGPALCCPLVLDFDCRRSRRERTWRQLTVAESLAAVSSDVAVGYRAQSGQRQWIFYRSLAAAGNRTLIGQNIAGEFCAGRLKKTGLLDEWIEIEACE